MKASDYTSSNYVKSSDLQGKTVVVTISAVAEEVIGQDKKKKPILYFVNKNKGAVLNKTNLLALSAAFGDEMLGWPNRQVELYSETVLFQGQHVQGLRMRPIAAQPAYRPPPPPAAGITPQPINQPTPAADPSDQIPF